jgi:hypothetical protein
MRILHDIGREGAVMNLLLIHLLTSLLHHFPAVRRKECCFGDVTASLLVSPLEYVDAFYFIAKET